ncbi:MAG: cobalamin-dependent protein [Desulfobulbaceae bacterium]|nr:cobalamin-dependent protein [Desulfobulbaceae bacterium]
MKILLISPNTLTVPYPVYPIGLDYVAGSIDQEHQVRIADLNVITMEELEGLITDYSPAIIGISCRNIDNTEAGDPLYFINGYRQLVDWLKARSNAIIVCGGSGFTIMPDEVFSALQADYGIIGEGERFGLLVEALAGGREPTKIPGVISSASAAGPPPPWAGKQQRKFRTKSPHNRFYINKGGMLNLQTKRGCSFRCIYCPYPHIEGKKHRLVPPREVGAIAKDLQEAGAKYLFITDSAFNSDVEHSLAVARAFKAAGVSIPWGGFFAPIRLPDGYFTVMADCGLRHVEFGTESLSKEMLKTYRKPFRIEDVLTAHRQAQKAGIYTAHYFLLGGPGESTATVTESLDNIERLKRAALFFFIGIRIYPWTTLYEIALKEGQINPDTNMLEPVFYTADAISHDAIEAMITARAKNRMNWIVGSGGEKSAQTVSKMHDRGHTGPLWELIAR